MFGGLEKKLKGTFKTLALASLVGLSVALTPGKAQAQYPYVFPQRPVPMFNYGNYGHQAQYNFSPNWRPYYRYGAQQLMYGPLRAARIAPFPVTYQFYRMQRNPYYNPLVFFHHVKEAIYKSQK